MTRDSKEKRVGFFVKARFRSYKAAHAAIRANPKPADKKKAQKKK